MSGHQHATLEDTVYFWFAANDTSGSGGDGATPLYDVREAGAASSAIPLLSGTPTLLTHANYPAGCHEIAVAATAANGFAADDTFAVFCTLAIDSQNPTGFVGSCTLTPLAKASALATVDTEVGQILADTGTDGVVLTAAAITAIWAEAGAAVNSIPGQTASMAAKIDLLAAMLIQKSSFTNTLQTLRNGTDAGDAGTGAITDAAGTTTFDPLA